MLGTIGSENACTCEFGCILIDNMECLDTISIIDNNNSIQNHFFYFAVLACNQFIPHTLPPLLLYPFRSFVLISNKSYRTFPFISNPAKLFATQIVLYILYKTIEGPPPHPHHILWKISPTNLLHFCIFLCTNVPINIWCFIQ